VKWSLDDPLATPRGLKDPAAAVAMLKAAVAKTKALYGAIDRPFGEVSRFHLGNVNLPGNGGFGNTGVFRTITWGPMKTANAPPARRNLGLDGGILHPAEGRGDDELRQFQPERITPQRRSASIPLRQNLPHPVDRPPQVERHVEHVDRF
jgi:hypothetical protein